MERISRKDIPFAHRQFLAGKIIAGRPYPEFFPFNTADFVINIGCGTGPQAAVYNGQYARMVGVDINAARAESAAVFLDHEYGVRNYEALCADVEDIPLPSASFDKAIAIDIAEHVKSPSRMFTEVHRLLRPGGFMLVTFPAMHDRYMEWGAFFAGRRRAAPQSAWNPDAHNHDMPVGAWIAAVEDVGFSFVRSRATTMFPPLHLYGVPRFWFSNSVIHAIDKFFCGLPVIKNYGQTLMCVFKK